MKSPLRLLTLCLRVAATLASPVSRLLPYASAQQAEAMIAGRGDGIDLDTLRVSESIAEETVAEFSQALGVSYQREKTGQRDPELLRKVLWSLEQSEQPRFPVEGEAWFRRAWRD